MFFAIKANKLIKILNELKMVATLSEEESLRGNLLVDVSDKSVYFLVSEGTTSVDILVSDASVKEAKAIGRLAFSYRKLYKFVTAFDIEKLENCYFEFRSEPGIVDVSFVSSAGNKTAGLQIQLTNHQFIPLPSSFKDVSFILNSDVAKLALLKIKHAIDQNHATPSYRHLYIHADSASNVLTFTGSNGIILSELKLPTPVGISGEFLIPLGYFNSLVHLQEEDVPLHFSLYEGEFKFKFGSGCFHGILEKGLTFQGGYATIFDTVTSLFKVPLYEMSPAVTALLGVLNKDEDPIITLCPLEPVLELYHNTSAFKIPCSGEVPNEFSAHVNGQHLIKILRAHSKASRCDDLVIGVSEWAAPIGFFTETDKYTFRSMLAPLNRKN